MVAVVPEEDSSSLKDKFTITDIIFLKKNKCRIKFAEGNSLVLESALVTNGTFYKGQTLTLKEIRNLKKRSEIQEAERVSIRLVAKNLHPERLLMIKLLKRGFKKKTINLVIKKLTNIGYLNDYDYAKTWLLSRIEKKPESNIKLYAELKKRGITNEIARKAISEIVTEEVEEKCIKEIIRKISRYKEFDNEYYLKFLSAKGFSTIIIKKILDEL